ncbi:DUF4391 domain-containing protein [Sunxiuqinia sp. A32]|uniref:DUF4391 domain-containing protein n=1 Tax=Sunxiuqinia sp. A32 TaxID=3461496 RepID=UPI004045C029
MDYFNLPIRTKVGRVIPKNAFDRYTSSKQKKLFADHIQRITWTHKISTETVNLESRDIREIQVFKIELKQKSDIKRITELINKAIPYHIVFWVEFEKEAYITTATKHLHPANEDIAVIDWTFESEWFNKDHNFIAFNLKGTLDDVFKEICVQLTGNTDLEDKPIEAILSYQKEKGRLRKKISKLRSAILTSKQFNEKVELNLKLKEAEKELDVLEIK